MIGEKKGGGLKGLESQSVSFISGMLEYEPDMEEADEIAEEDLIYLQDLSTKLDLIVRVILCYILSLKRKC